MVIPLLFGPYGSGALEYVDRLIEFGANACWFHMFDREAFDLCAGHQIAPCVEFKTFRADFHVHPELTPIGVDGKPVRYGALVQGICLSQHEYLEAIEEDLISGVRDYKPAGIWLDYLTYAGWFETPEPDLQESCFCGNCISEFCEAEEIDATTPGEILGRHASLWTRHKCERVAGHAARYAGLIREHLPHCVIGAYMCPWTPQEFDGALSRIFAQDYALLAPSIDVFTPLIYVEKSGRRATWGREYLEASASFVPQDRKVQLILDALDFPDSLLAVADSEQPSYGMQMFGGARIFSEPDQARVYLEAVEMMRQSVA